METLFVTDAFRAALADAERLGESYAKELIERVCGHRCSSYVLNLNPDKLTLSVESKSNLKNSKKKARELAAFVRPPSEDFPSNVFTDVAHDNLAFDAGLKQKPEPEEKKGKTAGKSTDKGKDEEE